MITPEQKAYIKWHINVPVCETRAGVKVHLGLLKFDDLRELVSVLGCSLDDLVDVIYKIKRASKRHVSLPEIKQSDLPLMKGIG